jgi:ComF family protein
MIHEFKYNGIVELSEMLAELMVERLKSKLPAGGIVVVPVPLHKKRQGLRGFNQSELLARYVSKRLNLPGGTALARTRNTDPQVGKSGMYRKTNLKGAFEVLDPELVSNKTVLLIDDVATTGSTLNECAKILKSSGLPAEALAKAGAKAVWGVVVARG